MKQNNAQDAAQMGVAAMTFVASVLQAASIQRARSVLQYLIVSSRISSDEKHIIFWCGLSRSAQKK